MDIVKTLKDVFVKYKYNIIVTAVAVLSIVGLCVSLTRGHNAKKIYDNNVKALTEQIDTFRTKNGQFAADKTMLLGDIKLLKTTNEDLYEQVRQLKLNKTDQVVYIETQVVNEVHDTTYVVPEINDYLKQSFDFSNQWRTLNGYIEYNRPNLGLVFENDIVNADYTIAIKDNKVYVTSTNPYVRYNDMVGITLPKYKPMWSLTIGPAIGGGYGLITQKPDIWVGFTATFGYSVLSFGKKNK